MKRTYKYRLYARKAQKRSLDSILGLGRTIYNLALEQRKKTYEDTGEGISYPAQWKTFKVLRYENPETFGKLNCTSTQQILRRLDKAFSAFFRRVKVGEKPGYPRFKGKNRFRSLEFTYGDGCKLREDADGRTTFYIQNVGEIKVKYHRQIPEEAKIKHAVLKQSFGEWYISLMMELPDPKVKSPPQAVVGVDMGLKVLLAFSDGTLIPNPRWLRTSLKKLRIAQRRVSRRKKGSHRRRKAKWQVAKIHDGVSARRSDFWHKLTRKMAENFGVIALEDLTLSFMTQNHRLALSAYDAGLGEFQRLLRYKAEETGTEVVAVNPKNTSQRCSQCKVLVPKKLSDRTHRCPECGLILDRDVNAARNILHLALSP